MFANPPRIVGASLLWLACWLPGWAQPGPDWAFRRLPASTQLYLEVQPRLALNDGPPLAERLRRSPLFRVTMNLIKANLSESSQVGEMMQSFPFLDGRFLLAVARQGEFSPFESIYRAEMASRHRRDLIYAVNQTFEAVNLYRRYQKKFPKTVQDLISKEHLNASDIPEGAQLELKRQGKVVTVVGRWENDGRTLEVRQPGPSPDPPALPDSGGGFVVGLGCPDSARFGNWVARWDAEMSDLSAEEDHWKLRVDETDYLIYFRNGWVYVTNQASLVNSLQAPATVSLATNPRFAEQFRQLNAADGDSWAFVDVQDILRSSPQLCGQAGWSADQILLRSLGFSSESHFDSLGQLEMQSRGFAQWDGVQNVTLGPAAAEDFASRVPPASETMYWLDLPGCTRLLDRVGGEFSGSRELIARGWSELEKRLGFSLARESMSGGAQLLVYGEVIDTYANSLEKVIRLLQSYFITAGPDMGDLLEFSVSKVPVLAVFETTNAELASRVQARLKERLGSGATARSVEGVTYTLSEDGRCGWTSSNTTQFWANGYTERLLPRIFKAYQGKTRSLADVPSFQLFQQDRQGEQFLYCHHMVDREYAFVKGLLLILGSDFRPEAEALGHLRDAHARLEVVPGGVRMRIGIYSEGALAPVKAPKAEEE